MAEKQGFTGQLNCDFDTSKNLEIFSPNLGRWHRVTSREFRSYNGKRRIQGDNYNGPVYSYATNSVVDAQLAEQDKIIGMQWKSIRRPGEDFY